MDPYLKWVGGKRRLVADLTEAINSRIGQSPIDFYCEPFAGSAALFFYLQWRVHEALLVDACERLIKTHQSVRKNPHAVYSALASLSTLTWAQDYYAVRAAFNAETRWDWRQAGRFIWLNRTNYNGMYRENQSGKYNVPVGRYKGLPAWPSASALEQAGNALRCADLQSWPDVGRTFRKVAAQHMPDAVSVVLLDPPFIKSDPADVDAQTAADMAGSAGFTTYTGNRFEEAETLDMLARAGELAKQGVVVVSCNHVTPWTKAMHAEHGFELFREKKVRRSLSAKKRWQALEGIWVAGGPTP